MEKVNAALLRDCSYITFVRQFIGGSVKFWSFNENDTLATNFVSQDPLNFFLRFRPAKYSSLVVASTSSLYCCCILSVVNAYKTRFSSFDQDIFKSICWLNQADWDLATNNYGLEDLLFLANHFKDMLNETGFNKDNLKSEWKSFKRMVNQNYASVKYPLSMMSYNNW